MNELNFHDMFPEDPNKETVTEEMHPEEKWFEEARQMTQEKLPDFITRMINGYNHDYGTACHAVSACALAGAWAAANSNSLGITGFQAGFVMWDFIRQWSKKDNKCGLRLIDYDKMLYPQYKNKFEKTIDPETWKCLQKEAKEKLDAVASGEDDLYITSDSVMRHWKSIVDGNVPFGYRVED